MPKRFSVWVFLALTACGPPMRPARTSESQAPSERELEAADRVRDADCGPSASLVFPGVAQLCQGRTAEGLTMTGLGAAELGTGLAVGLSRDEGFDGFSHPGAAVPLIAFQNTYAYSYADALFQEQLAARLLYVPEDTPAELLVAPFNKNVMGHTDVWAGTLVMLAAGIGLSAVVDEELGTRHLGEDANLFGRRFPPASGYPLAAGVGAGLFSHVAIGEEALFRGVLLSHMAREAGPTAGWVGSSVVFGVAHAPNALALPHEEQLPYLALGVPFITVLGSYLGLTYQWHDYSLAAPVAIHFWYDFLLSATFFALDPARSPLAASVRVPF
ncbi:MAG: CPBP family intramembrane metalloprotease [Myxococcales bacterium]|nr:CPBP family intramembrane metalloprotease [Myxococcales bacterium]